MQCVAFACEHGRTQAGELSTLDEILDQSRPRPEHEMRRCASVSLELIDNDRAHIAGRELVQVLLTDGIHHDGGELCTRESQRLDQGVHRTNKGAVLALLVVGQVRGGE